MVRVDKAGSNTDTGHLMFLRQVYDEDLAQAAWLLGCQKTGEAIVIDPERDIDRYIKLATEHGLRITAVAETHIHADFLSGTRQFAETTGAHVYVSGLGGEDWRSRWLAPYAHTELSNGETFKIGGIEFTTQHTPGHTPEHISFLVRDDGAGASEPIAILSGDFVFVGDLGRPDLLETAAGVDGAMEQSAHELALSARAFLELPDFLQVLPAHGAGSACGKALGSVPQSTVGYERRFNTALGLAEDESEFVAEMLSGQPAPPLYFARMKRENRDGVPLLKPLTPPSACTPEEIAASNAQVIDLRDWEHFRSGHLPGALWSKTGPFFCASIGSYVEPGRQMALICLEQDVERLQRCLARIGLDLVESWCSIKAFEHFQKDASKDVQLASIDQIDAATLNAMMQEGRAPQILDVRRTDEFDAGHLPGAVNIPHTRLLESPERIPEPKSGPKALLVHCLAGVRSATACSALQRDGHPAINLAGGWAAWQRENPVPTT